MSLSTLSIKRPVFTIVVNLTIILFGIIGYSYLGVREFPSIDPAQISVRTNYIGANADIISCNTKPTSEEHWLGHQIYLLRIKNCAHYLPLRTIRGPIIN